MNEEMRETLEWAIGLAATITNAGPAWEAAKMQTRIEDARAWLAGQPAEWAPVSGLQITSTDSRLKLIVRQTPDEIILVNPYRDDSHFPLPDDLRLCRRQVAQP